MNPADRIHPELHGFSGNEYYRRYQAKRRSENRRAGLTWDGKPRRRAIRFDLSQFRRNHRHAITNRERLQRLSRSPLENQWRAFVSS
jgi:hypothetical protein